MTSNVSYRLTEDKLDDVKDFESWTAPRMADYLKKAGLGEYGEIFINHKITGRLSPLLTDADLKEMGISIIGDRLRIKALILALGRKVRYDTRTKVIWEGEERLYFSDLEKVLHTCCGLFPDGKAIYHPNMLRKCETSPLTLHSLSNGKTHLLISSQTTT